MTPNESAAKHEWNEVAHTGGQGYCECGYPFGTVHYVDRGQYDAHIASLAAQPLVPGTEGLEMYDGEMLNEALTKSIEEKNAALEKARGQLDIIQRECDGDDDALLANDYGGTGWEKEPPVTTVRALRAALAESQQQAEPSKRSYYHEAIEKVLEMRKIDLERLNNPETNERERDYYGGRAHRCDDILFWLGHIESNIPAGAAVPICWQKEIGNDGICKACGVKAAITLEGLPAPRKSVDMPCVQDAPPSKETEQASRHEHLWYLMCADCGVEYMGEGIPEAEVTRREAQVRRDAFGLVEALAIRWDKIADEIDDGTHVTVCSLRACDFRSRAVELRALAAQPTPGPKERK
jgi:hypothetical protein